MNEDLIYRLRKRAEIRRQISTRKSVQEGKPDRIADLLEEAANALDKINEESVKWAEKKVTKIKLCAPHEIDFNHILDLSFYDDLEPFTPIKEKTILEPENNCKHKRLQFISPAYLRSDRFKCLDCGEEITKKWDNY
jgi:hypothetical protein